MRTHIVYIPGLSKMRYIRARSIALAFWRIYGVTTTVVPIYWYGRDTLEQMIQKVDGCIEELDSAVRVVVIGESAGATLALQAARLPRVRRVITLCGVTQPSTPIGKALQIKSPSLVQATNAIPSTVGRDVCSISSAHDPVVAKKYSVATGAESRTIFIRGHFLAIVTCLTILAPLMVTIAKRTKT